MKTLFFFIAPALFTGCRAGQAVNTSVDRNTVRTEVARRVEVATPADTAVAVYRLVVPPAAEHGAGGDPAPLVLEKVSETPGRHLRAPKVDARGGQLIITAIAEPQVIPVEVKDTYVHETENRTTAQVVVKNEPTAWQSVRIWIGNAVIALAGAAAVIQFLRIKRVLKF